MQKSENFCGGGGCFGVAVGKPKDQRESTSFNWRRRRRRQRRRRRARSTQTLWIGSPATTGVLCRYLTIARQVSGGAVKLRSLHTIGRRPGFACGLKWLAVCLSVRGRPAGLSVCLSGAVYISVRTFQYLTVVIVWIVLGHCVRERGCTDGKARGESYCRGGRRPGEWLTCAARSGGEHQVHGGWTLGWFVCVFVMSLSGRLMYDVLNQTAAAVAHLLQHFAEDKFALTCAV